MTASAAERESVLQALGRYIRYHERNLHASPPVVNVEPHEVRRWLTDHYDFLSPQPLLEVLHDVNRALLRWTEHARHPMHFGLFRPNVDLAAVVADALVALYDPNLAMWGFSPAANEMERHVLAAIARRFGYEPDSSVAHFTSGGQEANHSAVSAALTALFPSQGQCGLWELEGRPTFYLSEEGHHSFEKVAHATGLGRCSLRYIPTGSDLRMDVAELEASIARDREAGCLPFMVIATAGTTSAGVIDPLPELGNLCGALGLWFHVDAAWGGAAVLSDDLRVYLDGIERADSITCDAHKWFSVPVGAGMFFCRHPQPVQDTFTTDAAYVPPEPEGVITPHVSSMQWSRRFIGLKLFMTMATKGRAGMAERIERQAAVGEYLDRRLREEGWQVLNETALPVSVFTRAEMAGEFDRTEELVARVLATGEAWISSTLLRNEIPAVRACIANFDTGEEEVDRLLALLGEALVGLVPKARRAKP